MAGAVPIAVSTVFFLLAAILGVFFGAPKSPNPNRGLVQTMIVTTCICLYLFYIITFLAQLNPLIGPQLKLEEVTLKD